MLRVMENVINLSDGTNCGLDHDLKKQHAMKSYGGLPAGELPATDSRRRYFTPIPGLPAIPSLSDSLMTTEQKTELMTDLVNRICEYYDVAVEHVYIYRCFGKTTDYDRQVSAAVSCVIYTFRCLGVCCRRMARSNGRQGRKDTKGHQEKFAQRTYVSWSLCGIPSFGKALLHHSPKLFRIFGRNFADTRPCCFKPKIS